MRSLTTESLDDFLRPLSVETTLLVELARRFRDTYGRLAAKSEEQFLGTPVEEALLRPEGIEAGRYVFIFLHLGVWIRGIPIYTCCR